MRSASKLTSSLAWGVLRSSTSLLRHFVQQLLKVVDLHRLEEMSVASGIARLLFVALLPPASERDDGDVLAPGLLPNLPRRLVTIEPPHPHVHKDDLRLKSLRRLDRFDAVMGRL